MPSHYRGVRHLNSQYEYWIALKRPEKLASRISLIRTQNSLANPTVPCIYAQVQMRQYPALRQSPTPNQESIAIHTCRETENQFSPTECHWL